MSREQSNDVMPSIKRLRELRESLCSKQDEWKKAFKVRDFVISELEELHGMLVDENQSRKSCTEKAEKLLDYFAENKNHGEK